MERRKRWDGWNCGEKGKIPKIREVTGREKKKNERMRQKELGQAETGGDIRKHLYRAAQKVSPLMDLADRPATADEVRLRLNYPVSFNV